MRTVHRPSEVEARSWFGPPAHLLANIRIVGIFPAVPIDSVLWLVRIDGLEPSHKGQHSDLGPWTRRQGRPCEMILARGAALCRGDGLRELRRGTELHVASPTQRIRQASHS